MISQKEKYTSVLKDLCSIIENKSQKLDNRKITVAIAGAGCLGNDAARYRSSVYLRVKAPLSFSPNQILDLVG